ncbi:uncharacterized protein ASCRUDRAFT_13271 [Ascoidea rubescens DSM 1968]|uniref:Uncharacterized protein n=1 Tax=Ascoidea rubescens DSM 1968 TaxID=1344418 RepID=A0A1D2VJ21_9ASCO|nr:hypothetical protein ASCRUDRAFT_13271 [Ascoidea rubescens DSM 1968]ODV61628.1 hypothetical protein ASCRUDRAFT_13271 [Ascoidea rubescens DSM 1968]
MDRHIVYSKALGYYDLSYERLRKQLRRLNYTQLTNIRKLSKMAILLSTIVSSYYLFNSVKRIFNYMLSLSKKRSKRNNQGDDKNIVDKNIVDKNIVTNKITIINNDTFSEWKTQNLPKNTTINVNRDPRKINHHKKVKDATQDKTKNLDYPRINSPVVNTIKQEINLIESVPGSFLTIQDDLWVDDSKVKEKTELEKELDAKCCVVSIDTSNDKLPSSNLKTETNLDGTASEVSTTPDDRWSENELRDWFSKKYIIFKLIQFIVLLPLWRYLDMNNSIFCFVRESNSFLTTHLPNVLRVLKDC